jgi:cytochrome c peroxidase
MIRRTLSISVALLAAGSVQAQTTQQPALLQQARQIFKPLPENMFTPKFQATTAQIALGRQLFFDPRLSVDGTVSCATCHRPELFGSDGLPKSVGAKQRENARNAPTVLNAALQFKAHWIGDRENVEEQATRSLTGKTSFGNPDTKTVIATIKALPGYEAKFKQAFPNAPNAVSPENWGKAIGTYERTLVTPAPFDAYLKGDGKALDSQARAGLKLFINYGCSSCHNDSGIGGTSFQKFGVFEDYWKQTGSQAIDEGRYSVTHELADKYLFKVPSLRNVSKTPPYFHDGSVAKLADAIRIMGKVQLGKVLGDQDVNELLAFLNSLTGQLPANFSADKDYLSARH